MGKTTDGGNTWVDLTPNVSSSFSAIDFLDPNHGVAVGLVGAILFTNDGGANWSVQTSGTTEHLFNVQMLSSNSAIVVGENGTILKNTNITGVVDAQTEAAIEIFPNPANQLLTVRMGTNIQSISIYNELGRKVMESVEINSTEHSIDVSPYSPGIYYLNIITDKQEEIVRRTILQ
ncbi:MAG: T9SS type A sorting domain-containing protein [Bacteroidetes bacterium]|nr:T9SS type A sorting domain-containing protein [Bacteroidota bacterium]